MLKNDILAEWKLWIEKGTGREHKQNAPVIKLWSDAKRNVLKEVGISC